MSSFNTGLPASPRSMHHSLAPLDTSMRSSNSSQYASPSSAISTDSAITLVDMSRQKSDDIFANATIPLSPDTSSPTMKYEEQPFDGLVPRRRNGFARLFSCFGREERARRRAERFTEYEKVGEKCHWTEM